MGIDRDLLWRAYPDGHLARRGASTVGGWLCQNTPEDPYAVVSFGKDREIFSMGTFQADPLLTDALEAGELLPNVDPTDTATWACLLRDLADSKGRNGALVGTGWVRDLDGTWCLSSYTCDIRDLEVDKTQLWRFDGLDTEDPGLALVKARIQVRERTR